MNIDYKINPVQFNDKDQWKHFQWIVLIGNETFNYKTGIGHGIEKFNRKLWKRNGKPKDRKVVSYQDYWAYIPEIKDILECLFLDAQCGEYSFKEFCDNLGYNSDSISALKLYHDCQENGDKLKKALGSQYDTIKNEVLSEEI